MTNDQRWEFYVAGVKFHQAHTVLRELKEGDELIMELEPTNEYDSSAVKLLFGETAKVMLGYVPGKISAIITAFIETRENACCNIVLLDPSEKPWKQIKVVIEERKDNEEEGK